jgi:thioredoxin 2
MAPTFEAAAKQFEPRVRFLKLNADQTQSPAQVGVRGIPALILFHEGREIDRQAGLMSADQLSAWLNRALASVSTLESH